MVTSDMLKRLDTIFRASGTDGLELHHFGRCL